MVSIARVLKDVCAPPPAGCGSDQVKRVLRDFFSIKCPGSANHYWLRYRAYAHYLKLERNAWPGAIESLFRMDQEKALNRIQAFRSWIKATGRLATKTQAGTERPCMYTLFKLAKERGVISWKYPPGGEILTNKAWEKTSIPFRKDAELWIGFLRGMNYRPLSLVNRNCHIRHFGAWLKARRQTHLEINDKTASGWVSWIVSQDAYSDHYKSGMMATVRNFYRWLRLKRAIPENPFDGMGRFRLRENLPKVCTEPEVLGLIRAAKDPLDRAIIEILYATGCRVSELCAIDIKDVSFDARHIKVLGKWRRERMVLFNDAATRAIRAFLPIRTETLKRTNRYWEPALLVTAVGSRLRPTVVQKVIKKLAKAANASDEITPHTIRHSFATHLLNHGADLFTLMHLMGHKSIAATVKYLRVATVRLAEVYKRCHPRK